MMPRTLATVAAVLGLVAVAGAVAGDMGARALYGEAIEAVAPAESP